MPYDCERDIEFHAVYKPLDGGGRDCFFRCGGIFISLAARQAYLDERPDLANSPYILVSARESESLKDHMVSAELRELGATPVNMEWPNQKEGVAGKNMPWTAAFRVESRRPMVIVPGTRPKVPRWTGEKGGFLWE